MQVISSLADGFDNFWQKASEELYHLESYEQ